MVAKSEEQVKQSLGPQNSLYPLPTTLVGAQVDGKPNYLAIAHVGVMAMHHVSVSMNKRHYTHAGVAACGAFSVNLPSLDLLRETDYCGLVSGRDVDKAALFTTFYGELGVPMIAECPVNMECRLVRTLDFETHDVFVGRVVQTYCEDRCLTNGKLDLTQVQPILFAMPDRSYWTVGERAARAWDVGKELK
jgi:flavin reductase (DIM6/NTAB) family NADH-FMN oxidoreductase RutF